MLRDKIQDTLLFLDDCYAAIDDEDFGEEDEFVKDRLFNQLKDAEDALKDALSTLGE